MQEKSHKQLFNVVLQLPLEITRTVKIRASSRERAERKALKFNPNALGIYRPDKKG